MSTRLRRRALRETEVTLEELLATGRTMETSEHQASGIEKTVQTPHSDNLSEQFANKVAKVKYSAKFSRKSSKSHNKQTGAVNEPNNICRNCGGKYPHRRGFKSCSARGVVCNASGKLHHFQKFCMSSTQLNEHKTVHNSRSSSNANNVLFEDSSSSDDEYVYGLLKAVSIHRHRLTFLEHQPIS